jgi:hypothetical protein
MLSESSRLLSDAALKVSAIAVVASTLPPEVTRPEELMEVPA